MKRCGFVNPRRSWPSLAVPEALATGASVHSMAIAGTCFLRYTLCTALSSSRASRPGLPGACASSGTAGGPERSGASWDPGSRARRAWPCTGSRASGRLRRGRRSAPRLFGLPDRAGARHDGDPLLRWLCVGVPPLRHGTRRPDPLGRARRPGRAGHRGSRRAPRGRRPVGRRGDRGRSRARLGGRLGRRGRAEPVLRLLRARVARVEATPRKRPRWPSAQGPPRSGGPSASSCSASGRDAARARSPAATPRSRRELTPRARFAAELDALRRRHHARGGAAGDRACRAGAAAAPVPRAPPVRAGGRPPARGLARARAHWPADAQGLPRRAGRRGAPAPRRDARSARVRRSSQGARRQAHGRGPGLPRPGRRRARSGDGGGRGPPSVPCRLAEGRGSLAALLRDIDGAAARSTRLSDAVGGAVRRSSRPGGSLVVVSDFLDPGPCHAALGRARAAGHEIALVQVLSPEELDPPWDGDLELEDAETGERVAMRRSTPAPSRPTGAASRVSSRRSPPRRGSSGRRTSGCSRRSP